MLERFSFIFLFLRIRENERRSFRKNLEIVDVWMNDSHPAWLSLVSWRQAKNAYWPSARRRATTESLTTRSCALMSKPHNDSYQVFRLPIQSLVLISACWPYSISLINLTISMLLLASYPLTSFPFSSICIFQWMRHKKVIFFQQIPPFSFAKAF